jgi:alpha,alpha-trehalose phosphorylase
MLHKERIKLPEYVYPPEEWRLAETQFNEKFLETTETIFSIANGYLGMRAAPEEGRPAYHNGTFINGFYESWPIIHGEDAYGFAKTGQSIVNVPGAKVIRLYVDDEPFYLPTANLLSYERALNMKDGTLDRELVWETPSGKQIAIKSRRIISFSERHLAAIVYEITAVNEAASIDLSSKIVMYDSAQMKVADPRKGRDIGESVLSVEAYHADDLRMVMGYRTKNSGMTMACGMDHLLNTECKYSVHTEHSDERAKVVFSIDAKPGKTIQLIKLITYHSSRGAPPEELCVRASRTLERSIKDGYKRIFDEQREFMDDFWRRSDIRIDGDISLQQAVRWNLFQMLQATGRSEGTGVPAKGLTGQGYDGHYFWDTEIYVIPFLVYTAPRIARNILLFRHSMLDKARKRAKEVNQKGALFPWRTINGDESSAYYAAGTAQYHINADIMYALRKYVNITGDDAFLYDFGAEMLVETARLWADLGFFSDQCDGKFCIHGVTGPDEYNTVVDNNTYTNLMARENLWYAAETVEVMKNRYPQRFAELVDKTGLDFSEIAEWRRAADNMYIPFDEKLGIHPQDDDFLSKEVWNFKETPAENYPLLLHYHPLVIYRHQVIKQADIVLAMFLLEHEFSNELKKSNFDYYDPLTTGDSSLSVCIQSMVAFECGYVEKAREYAWYAMRMDLADIHGNVKEGCHIASMGGTWMAIVYGFAGLRDYGGRIAFNPVVPKRDGAMSFPLTVRGQTLVVTLDGESQTITYLLREGSKLEIVDQGDVVTLKKGKKFKSAIKPKQYL